MKYKHEFVFGSVFDEDHNLIEIEAPRMSALAKLAQANGQTETFNDYAEFEDYLWSGLDEEFARIDADSNIGDDYEHSAEYKRNVEKHRLRQGMVETIVMHRETMLAQLSGQTA